MHIGNDLSTIKKKFVSCKHTCELTKLLSSFTDRHLCEKRKTVADVNVPASTFNLVKLKTMRKQIHFVLIFLNLLIFTFASNKSSVSLLPKPSDTMGKLLFRLIGERPTTFILDNQKLEHHKKFHNIIYPYKGLGFNFFEYKPFLENRLRSGMKPIPIHSNYRFTTSYGWVFICLLELSHSQEARDEYLNKLLIFGNGRNDKFIFIGDHYLVRPLFESSLIRKFRNVIGIESGGVSGQVIYFRETCTNTLQSFDTTFDLSHPTWIAKTANCLNGHRFNVAGTDFPPFMYFLHPEDSKIGSWEIRGVNYELLKSGGKIYNFTVSVDHPTKWKLMGEQSPDGKWDGIFGDLVYGRAEIASVSNPTLDRSGLADFIGPFSRSELVFMTANPIAYADAGEYAIFFPFPLYCWFVLLGGFGLVWALNSIALGSRYYMGQKSYANRGTDSIINAFMMVMAFSFEQEINKPKGLPLRFLMIIWVSFMVIMATSYKYNLASYIVTPRPNTIPKTFEELYEHKEYTIIFDLGGISGWNYFRTNPNPKIQALTNRAFHTEDTSNCTVSAFQKISTVCAGWDFSLQFAASKNLTITLGRPALVQSQPFLDAWFVFAIENNSVFYNEFRKIGWAFFETGLMKMWEEGVLREQKYRGKRWLADQKNSVLYKQLTAFKRRSSRNILEKLNWKNVRFIFVIFGAGILLSCLTFLVEICHGHEGVRKMFYRKKMKVRKISRHVLRKIGGELTPSQMSSSISVISFKEQQRTSSEKQVPVITVTFLP